MSSLLNSNFAKRAVSFGGAWFNPTPVKRYVHRAADFTYAKLWKQEKTGFFMGESAGHALHSSPSLVERIMKIMVAMTEKGYTPFLHAMPAAAKVVRKFNAVVHPVSDPHYKYLRSPSDPEFRESMAEAESRTAPSEGKWRPDLLSMSYGVTSGVKPLESAASWGFQNHFGKEQNFPMVRLYEQTLRESGLDPQSKPYTHFWKRGWDLIRNYGRQSVGNFMVLGVPKEKVDRFVYDSMPFNIPTGEKASSVAADPEKYKQSLFDRRTHMATMRLCQETLGPGSGIRTVDAQDEREVDDFCSGMKFRKLHEFPEYEGLVSPHPTEFERSVIDRQKELDRNLDELTEDFHSYLQNPGKGLSSYKEQEETVRFDCEWLP